MQHCATQQDREAGAWSFGRDRRAAPCCAAARSRWRLGGMAMASPARQFFFAPEHPLEAAAMDGEPEGALQIGLQIADAPGRALAPPLLDIGKDLRRQLVPLLRPATLRQQTGEPFRREGVLCLYAVGSDRPNSCAVMAIGTSST